MLEHPDFRPKVCSHVPSLHSLLTCLQLFFAGNHIHAGQEEKFPGPDNHSKMRRSVENAEHVGLFAPSRYIDLHWYLMPNPGALASGRGRPLRRTDTFDYEGPRRRGVYLPPARAYLGSPEARNIPQHLSPNRRQGPVLVDTRSPFDPFAGRDS